MAKRLLVVDDEPGLLQAIAVCLRAKGYEVATARSGEEALVQLTGVLPDLIISDIRMPGMNGYQLARQLRSAAHTSLIPIIFLTAKAASSDRIEGLRSGVDAYLTKPFEPEELLAVVSNIFERLQRNRAEMARLVGDLGDRAEAQFHDEELTEAEERIAAAVARGLSNKEIAAEFGVSVRTVGNHISNILAKKGFSNRVDIARCVFKRDQTE